LRRVAFAIVAAAALVPTAASAAPRTSYCSPSGDYCTSVKRQGDDFVLRIGTFAFSGRYRLCVTPPRGARTCKPFRLREQDAGINGSSVRWSRNFPAAGPGRYRVAWRKFGNRLGPRLGFRR
jgi:hypothetical protein